MQFEEQGWHGWEHSSPNNATRVRFQIQCRYHNYVVWICYWFCLLLRIYSPASGGFLPPQKPNNSTRMKTSWGWRGFLQNTVITYIIFWFPPEIASHSCYTVMQTLKINHEMNYMYVLYLYVALVFCKSQLQKINVSA